MPSRPEPEMSRLKASYRLGGVPARRSERKQYSQQRQVGNVGDLDPPVAPVGGGLEIAARLLDEKQGIAMRLFEVR